MVMCELYCGSWLACDGGGSVGSWGAGRPLSQASQLPHWIGVVWMNGVRGRPSTGI
ncbi:hypothetical protein AK972_2521 [Pseudomonas yamanorum]|nr:hypothetical protein AK972_2521 [Pseudomonas yamanorum]